MNGGRSFNGDRPFFFDYKLDLGASLTDILANPTNALISGLLSRTMLLIFPSEGIRFS